MLTNLRDATLELVRNRPRHITYRDIEAATAIKKEWLAKFQQGKFDDPGVNRVETLYTFLSGKTLGGE